MSRELLGLGKFVIDLRPVDAMTALDFVQAKIDDDMILFSFAGDQPKQQTIHDDLPKPAHQV